MRKKVQALPFCVVRNSVKTLVEQTLDGLHGAITCGYYKPGDVLPPMRVFTEQLGVSRIVMNEVIARLKAEGLVNSRPRVGCVVLDRNEKIWKGRVLLVNPIGDDNYYNGIFAGVIRDSLIANGYLFLSCTVPQLETKRYDFSTLEHLMQRSIDLVVLSSLKPEIVRFVSRFGVPYVSISQFPVGKTKPPCATAVIDWNAAVGDFVTDLKRNGIETVEQVSWVDTMADAVPALEAAGLGVRRWVVRADRRMPRIMAVKEAGYRAFAERFSSPDPRLPELFFFTDDNLAEGAFLAMAERGIRIPGDIGVVTWANYGSAPVFGKPLTRMEMNPYADGEKAAKWILGVLNGTRKSDSLVLGPKYVFGQTLKQAKERKHS